MDKLYLVLGDVKIALGTNVSKSAVEELREIEGVDLRSELKSMLGENLEARINEALDQLINEYLSK